MEDEMSRDLSAEEPTNANFSEDSESTAAMDDGGENKDVESDTSEPELGNHRELDGDDGYASGDNENDDASLSGGNHWRPSSESISEGEDGGQEIKVAVDWIEFEGSLENNSPELHSFLNIVTGDVVRFFEGSENAETQLKQAEASPDFLYVEPVSSREQYRWMEEFIEIVEDPTLKDKLNIAIDGKGAFRRFKDVLMGYPSERERWFGKRSAKLREHMASWLESKHVVAVNTPPWEGEGQPDEIRPRGDFGAKGWRTGGSDLRAQAHELIDMVPSRELPSAVAFLEFLRSRRSYKRPRFS